MIRHNYTSSGCFTTDKVQLSTSSISASLALISSSFAFATASDDFAELKGTQLILDIPDFPVKEERTMEGVVIRSTDNHGEYIVGCRMPEDSPAIQKYVNDNYKE